MDIRRGAVNDINLLAELFDQYRVFYEKESDLTGAIGFLTQRFENNESVIFVAEEDEVLLGFVQLYPIFSSTRMNRLWLLNDLFVNTKYRGRGLSVKLIDASKEYAKITKSAGLILETAQTNDIGNKLYPRVGFVLDTEHNYYSWDV